MPIINAEDSARMTTAIEKRKRATRVSIGAAPMMGDSGPKNISWLFMEVV
jgi:hypothetical protein